MPGSALAFSIETPRDGVHSVAKGVARFVPHVPGSALTALGPALADPGHIYNTIGEALSKSSNFFINYITVQVRAR